MKTGVLLTGLIFSGLLLSGCLSEDVLIRQVSASARPNYGQTISAKELSPMASNLLANLTLRDAYDKDPASVITQIEQFYRHDARPELLLALANLSWSAGVRSATAEPDFAASAYLSTMVYAYTYLARLDQPKQEPYNPQRFMMMRMYNQAQTELFAYLKARSLLFHSSFQINALNGRQVFFSAPKFDLPVLLEDFDDIQLCADYRPERLLHISYRFGIGTPLIFQLRKGAKLADENVHAGQTLPITLVTQFGRNSEQQYSAQMYFIDTLEQETIELGSAAPKEFPLELDFSTPLAYMTKRQPLYNFLRYALNPGETQQMQGLYLLQPYDPDRIPVVFVHGLMSNLRTWLQMVNTLQNDPEIRKRYQFWGFSYSSGNPILFSAKELRDSLDQLVAREKAHGVSTKNLERMVLVGHSMGGLLSKTLIMNSDGKISTAAFDLPWDRLEAEMSEDQRKLLHGMLAFTPRSYVRRIVFIAVPHRGSELATSWIGKIGSGLITLPSTLAADTRDVLSHLRRYVHPHELQTEDLLPSNGIDNLRPNNPTLVFLDNIPFAPDVPYHSIIGNEERGNTPGGSDGVVPYSSAHLDGATSELVVKSGHSAQQQPLAILEMRRILLEHLQSYPDTRREEHQVDSLLK